MAAFTTASTLPRLFNTVFNNSKSICRKYAIKKAAGRTGGAGLQKKKLEVETDPVKLVNYVCGSNIYKDGEDIKLKPDSEYPDWLWTLKTDGPLSLEEMDPNTLQYWRRVRKINRRLENARKSVSKIK